MRKRKHQHMTTATHQHREYLQQTVYNANSQQPKHYSMKNTANNSEQSNMRKCLSPRRQFVNKINYSPNSHNFRSFRIFAIEVNDSLAMNFYSAKHTIFNWKTDSRFLKLITILCRRSLLLTSTYRPPGALLQKILPFSDQ